MSDDILLRKAATIERCIARAREEHSAQCFETSETHQDAAILNVQRACKAIIDMGLYIIRHGRLGQPQQAEDIFDILAHHGRLDQILARRMKTIPGLIDSADNDYQSLQLPIAVQIIRHHLDDFLQYNKALLQHDSLHRQ